MSGLLETLHGIALPGGAMAQGVFYAIAGVTVAGAVLSVSLRNLFHSALALAVALAGLSGVYLYLQAEFLAMIQVLVYVGAVVTLMVFAVMLTTDIAQPHEASWNQLTVPAAACAVGVIGLVVCVAGKMERAVLPAASPGFGETKAMGHVLMKEYVVPFEVLSLVLLVALVGAVALGGLKAPKEERRDRIGGARS